MRSNEGMVIIASIWTSLVVLSLLACCVKLHSMLHQRLEHQRTSALAGEISRLLFLVSATEGEVETVLELNGVSNLNISGGNPVSITVVTSEASATRRILLPLPVVSCSLTNPSRLRILKSDLFVFVKND